MRKIITNDQHKIETGALTVNEDWPGLYIRGDDCIYLSYIIRMILEENLLSNFDQVAQMEALILKKYCDIIEKEVLCKVNDENNNFNLDILDTDLE